MRAAAGGSGAVEDVFTKPLTDWSPGALLQAVQGGDWHSDGLVPTELSRWGKKFVLLQDHYDHGGIIEDPAVPDAILRELHKG